MRQQRWFPIAVLAGILFAINAATRLVIRLWFHDNDTVQGRATMLMFTLVGIGLAVAVFRRSQRVAPVSWLPTIGLSALSALLLTVLVGPFISGSTPFADGTDAFLSQIAMYVAFTVVGVLLGYWIATALGRDIRSRSLTAVAKGHPTKPHRAVRR